MKSPHLTWRDRIQLMNAIAFFVIGIMVILRSLPHPIILTWLVGGGFIAISLYRLYYFLNYYQSFQVSRARGD